MDSPLHYLYQESETSFTLVTPDRRKIEFSDADVYLGKKAVRIVGKKDNDFIFLQIASREVVYIDRSCPEVKVGA